MKKRLSIALAAGALIAAMLPGVASANGNGAIVDQKPSDPGGCAVIAANHRIPGYSLALFTDHVSEVWSRGGPVKFTCQGQLPEGVSVPPGYRTSGWGCPFSTPGQPGVFTTDTSFKANPGGHWTMTCRFSPVS